MSGDERYGSPPRFERRLTNTESARSIDDAARINLLWLLRLRWFAILGQALTVAAVQLWLGFNLTQPIVLLIIACEVASNLACAVWARRGGAVHEWAPGGLMVVDLLFLTGLLAVTGGAYNPFSFLYLIHIALAAVTLRSAWAWGIVVVATVLFGSLFLQPIDHADHAMNHQHFRMHLEGMWVAFTLAASFIAYFVQRVTGALAERDHELAQARDLAQRHERLAALATLAAGAAHELGTPLATIAVAAGELDRQLTTHSEASVREDLSLIRAQVARCREILSELTQGSGESMGEGLQTLSTGDLVKLALQDLPQSERIRVELTPEVADTRMRLPVEAAARALRNVLKNAAEAAPDDSEVLLRGGIDSGQVALEVCDRGPGIPREVLDRLGEPFFTTKEAGKGMGLGLFLSRSILGRVGGQLSVHTELGRGTVATITVPAMPAAV